MFDIGWQEIFIISVLTIIVVGPKELPKVLQTVTRAVKKARQLIRDFQSGIDEMVREAGLADVKEQMESGVNIDIESEVEKIVDPQGSISKGMNMRDIEQDLNEAGSSINKEDSSGDALPRDDDHSMVGDHEDTPEAESSASNKASG
ncbi:MAG: Sec-independent protein translocase protein TatB [Rhodospirillales bacterium]